MLDQKRYFNTHLTARLLLPIQTLKKHIELLESVPETFFKSLIERNTNQVRLELKQEALYGRQKNTLNLHWLFKPW